MFVFWLHVSTITKPCFKWIGIPILIFSHKAHAVCTILQTHSWFLLKQAVSKVLLYGTEPMLWTCVWGFLARKTGSTSQCTNLWTVVWTEEREWSLWTSCCLAQWVNTSPHHTLGTWNSSGGPSLARHICVTAHVQRSQGSLGCRFSFPLGLL